MSAVRSRFMPALVAILLLVPGLTIRPAGQASLLQPLAGVDELKSWFNANRAHARLVLLLSPT